MQSPTLQSTSVPAPVRASVSAITPKGRCAVQLARLQALVDDLAEAERQDLADELAILVRTARARIALRKVVA